MEVKEFIIEQTGGYVYVAWGQFNNGNYFAISSDILLIYDEDERKVMDAEDYDGYTWQQQHTIASYSYDTKEFAEVLNQLWVKCTYSDKYGYDLFSSIEEE